MKKLAIVGAVLLTAACGKIGQGPGCGGRAPASLPAEPIVPALERDNVQDVGSEVSTWPANQSLTDRTSLPEADLRSEYVQSVPEKEQPKADKVEGSRKGREFAERVRKSYEQAREYIQIRDKLAACKSRIAALKGERKRLASEPSVDAAELKQLDDQISDEVGFAAQLEAKLRDLGTDGVLLAVDLLESRSNECEPMPFGASSFGPWDTGTETPRP